MAKKADRMNGQSDHSKTDKIGIKLDSIDRRGHAKVEATEVSTVLISTVKI